MLKRYLFKKPKRAQRLAALLVVVSIAGIGTYLLTGSHAATPYISTTADSGTLTSSAVKQTCSGATDGNCVVFGGTDTNATCNMTISPGADVGAAMSSMASGQTLCLNGGTYSGNIDDTLNASNVTMQAVAGQRPVIQGLFWVTNPNDWTFDGINVTWPSSGATGSDHMVKITNGSGWTWKNSEIWGAHSFADVLVAGTVSGQPANWTLTNNCIHDTYPTNATNQDHNLYVNTGVTSGPGTITHNIFYNATNGENVKLAGGDSSQGTANITVDHNTLYNASQNILIGWTSQNNLITKNLIVDGINAGNVRGFELTGTNNIVNNNEGYQAANFISNYDGGLGVTDGGGNVFPVNPNFGSLTCGTLANGIWSGFATTQPYGYDAGL